MTQISRKTCARCGEENLSLDWRCWACGAALTGPGASAGAAPALVRATNGGDAPTLMPAAPGGGRPVLTPVSVAGTLRAVAAVIGLGVLLLGVSIGWVLSRLTLEPPHERALPAVRAPLIPGPLAYSAQPSAPIHLPPPVGPRPPTGSPWTPAAGPVVTRSSPWPGAGAAPPRLTRLPSMTVPPSWGAFAARPGVGAGPRRGGPPPVPRSASSAASAAVPTAGAADRPTLRIQNTAQVPLEMELQGPVLQSGRVAPGAQIAFPLPPGSYSIVLVGGGRRERLEGIELRPGRHYSVVFAAGGASMDGP